MKPNAITLEGFIGIRSGLGKESITLDLTTIPDDAHLVAIVGPNGGAKTTILDNLHPYRVMPSHQTTTGIGGFSYWDHVAGPTAKKELFWQQGGRHFQTVLTFRMSGKTRKADCYLLEWKGGGTFEPVTLSDGTTSDGSATTYDRCVEAIVGPPEAFFMSLFSAQSKKPLASYQASEIKALLAAILEQSDLRVLAEKANLVGKLVKMELDKLQDGLAQSRAAAAQLEETNTAIAKLDAELVQKQSIESKRIDELETARKALTVLETKRDSGAVDLEQRSFLNGQIEKARAQAQADIERVTRDADGEMQRLAADKSRNDQELTAAGKAKHKLEEDFRRLQEILAQKPEIDAATKNLPQYQAKIAELDAEKRAVEAKLAALRPIQEAMQMDNEELARLQTSGSAKADIIATLRETAALIDQVPCKGSPMQGTCSLLKNAVAARNNVSPQETALADLRHKYREIRVRVAAASEKLAEMPALEEAVKRITTERNTFGDLSQEASKLVGMAEMVADAANRLEALETERKGVADRVRECSERGQQLLAGIAVAEQKRQTSIAGINARVSAEVQVLESQLAKLAQPVSLADIDAASKAVDAATTALDEARAAINACREQRNELSGRILVLTNLQQQAAADVKHAETLSDELAKWKLIEKGLGTSGLIALMIDDAGPEISSLCNDLLTECYDGRFSVRLETQRETEKGVREDFEVIVMDNHRGGEKSLRFMSGGEKVWVTECLLRAIALFVGQTSGIQHHTLFSDETDGALDEERKRQFMRMKRAVLKRGGYQREYFISQTRELWEMADHIIDVRKL